MHIATKLAAGAVVTGAVVFGTAMPAFADSISFSSATVTQGSTITINVACDPDEGGEIQGMGAFANIPVGAPPDDKPSYTATVTGAPGTYVVNLRCFDSWPGPDGSDTPATLVVTAAPVPSKTPVPSGAPKTGGGGASTGVGSGVIAGGLSLLAAAGLGALIYRRHSIG